MSLTINVVDSNKVDETAGLQDDDILLASVPAGVGTAFSSAGVNLNSAIQIAGDLSNDITLTDVTGTVGGLGFVDSNGNALDGDTSGLYTLDGELIFLYADPTNDNVVLGRAGEFIGGVWVPDSDGAIVFAIYLEETGSPISGARLWTALFEPLAHTDPDNPDDTLNLGDNLHVAASSTTAFSFAGAPAGSNIFMMFGDADLALVVTGRAPDNLATAKLNDGDTVSSSKGGGPTTLGSNGQQLKAGVGLYFTFVTGAEPSFTVPDLSPKEAKNEDNIQFDDVFDSTSASFTVSQMTPTNAVVTIKISAFTTDAETSSNYVEGIADADDVAVNITKVYVNGVEVAADLSGLTAIVSGVQNGDVVTYDTDGVHNRVLIENAEPAGSNITFDIGGFALGSTTTEDVAVGQAVQFDDDGPTTTATQLTGTVDEDGLANGIAGGTGDVAGTATTATGNVSTLFSSGVDTPLTYALDTDTSGLPALSSGGVALVYSVVGNVLTATAGPAGPTVFTFTLNVAGVAGDYNFTLSKPLDHAAGLDENDITINLSSIVQAVDDDGDKVTAAASALVITADDDSPTATATELTGTVDEDGLANGIAGGTGDVAGTATTATGNVSSLFNSGADTPLTFSLKTDTSGLPALSSGGVALVYSVVGNVLTARAGAAGPTVFTFTLNVAGIAGDYNFTLSKPLDHATGLDENDITINLSSIVQAKDYDQDPVNAGANALKIIVDDDSPQISPAIQDGTVEFADGETATDSGFLGYGADGPKSTGPFVITTYEAMPDDTILGTITESLSTDGKTLTYTSEDYGLLFTLQLNATAPGGYTFTVERDLPLVINVLDFGSVDPGGPVEEISIPVPGGTNNVNFDGFFIQDFDGAASLAAQFLIGDDETDDEEDVNVSAQGVGLKDNQMDPLEALQLTFDDPVDGVQLIFEGATGGGQTIGFRVETYDNGVLVDTFTGSFAAPKGNATWTEEFVSEDQFDEIYIALDIADKSGVRIKSVATIEKADVEDFSLDYTVTATDFDGDTATDSFTVNIDSDADGTILLV